MIPEPLQFNGNDFNCDLLKGSALKLDIDAEKSASNQFGIYHDEYRPKAQDANRRRTHCYYLCDPDSKECVNSPPVGKAWYDTIPQIFDEIQALERATRTLRELPHDVIDIVARARYLAEERPTKRARLDEEADNSSSLSSATTKSPATLSTTIELLPPVVVVVSPESSPPAPAQKLPAGSNIYWDSADAKNLFNASDNETSLHRLDDLVEVLEQVNQLQSVGYKSIVAGHDADDSLLLGMR